AGHTPYTANTNQDGDQSNLADEYFGRGNSPEACALIIENTFAGNGIDERSVGPVTPVENCNITNPIPVVPPVDPVDPGDTGGQGQPAEVAQSFPDSAFITKTVDKTVAQVGDTLTFTIQFGNPKGITLNNVVIADAFDSRLSNVRVISNSVGTPVV